MSRKPIDLCWAFSLIVIGACTVIRFGAEILGFELPDFVVYMIPAGNESKSRMLASMGP